MRKLIAAILVAGAAAVAGQAVAADLPYYPPVIEVPDVDYGVEGSFYLRGSAAGNLLWGNEARAYECVPGCGGGLVETRFPFTAWGYGYSAGVGAGYETGTGLRFDGTLDFIGNTGLQVTKGPEYGVRQGNYRVNLRSTLALANVYYDFSFGGDLGYGAAGGAFGYVGAGAGLAFNHLAVDTPAGVVVPEGGNTSFAAAGMVGVGYDFGAVVADVGYRGVYINHLSNGDQGTNSVWSDHNWLHEVRGTVRYRFN